MVGAVTSVSGRLLNIQILHLSTTTLRCHAQTIRRISLFQFTGRLSERHRSVSGLGYLRILRPHLPLQGPVAISIGPLLSPLDIIHILASDMSYDISYIPRIADGSSPLRHLRRYLHRNHGLNRRRCKCRTPAHSPCTPRTRSLHSPPSSGHRRGRDVEYALTIRILFC